MEERRVFLWSRLGSGRPESVSAASEAAAGARASMETTTPCTGGSTVSTYAFYESSRTKRRHAQDQMATGASSTMSSCGGVLSGERGAAATAC